MSHLFRRIQGALEQLLPKIDDYELRVSLTGICAKMKKTDHIRQYGDALGLVIDLFEQLRCDAAQQIMFVQIKALVEEYFDFVHVFSNDPGKKEQYFDQTFHKN